MGRDWKAVLPSVLGVLAIAGGLLYATATSHPPAAPPPAAIPVPLPSPSTIIRDGTVYTARLASIAGAQADPHDPRALRLYLFAAHSGSDHPECNAYSPRVRVVRETATAVTVAGFTYRTPPPGRDFGCAYFSSSDDPMYRALAVHLAAPLGERLLIDADSGRHIGVLHHQHVPEAGYVPQGYHATATPSTTVEVSDMEGVRSYAGPGRRNFSVRLASASYSFVTDDVTGHVTVNGIAAIRSTSPYERCVAWEQPVGFEVEVCTPRKQGLPDDELLRVARSVH